MPDRFLVWCFKERALAKARAKGTNPYDKGYFDGLTLALIQHLLSSTDKTAVDFIPTLEKEFFHLPKGYKKEERTWHWG